MLALLSMGDFNGLRNRNCLWTVRHVSCCPTSGKGKCAHAASMSCAPGSAMVEGDQNQLKGFNQDISRREYRFGIEKELFFEIERSEYGCWCLRLVPKLGLNLALYLSAVSGVFLNLHVVHLPWAATDGGVELWDVLVGLWSSAGPQEKSKLPLSPVCFQRNHHARIHRHYHRYGWEKLVHVEAQGLHGAVVLTCLHLHAQTTCLPTSPNTNMHTINCNILLVLHNSTFESKVISSQVSWNADPFLLSFHQRATSIWIFCTAPAAQPWRRLIQPLANKLTKIPCPFLSKSQLL